MGLRILSRVWLSTTRGGQKYLEERGIRVIRFENKGVYKDVETVLEEIRRNLVNEDKS